MRPNEAFSGGGHARCLCRECSRLGKDELAARQAENDPRRLVDLDGIVPRRRRAEVERYLEYAHPRVRETARRVLAEDRERRAELRRMYEEDERRAEELEREADALMKADPDEREPPRVVDLGEPPF